MADDESTPPATDESSAEKPSEDVPEAAPETASPQPSQRSKSGSAAASATSRRKSGAGTARSGKSPADSARSGKSPDASRKMSKAKKEKKRAETPATDISESVLPVPEGCLSIFISAPSQAILNIVADEDVTKEEPIKFVSKADILADVAKRAAVSEFKDHKKTLEALTTADVLLKYDPNWRYGANFLMALTEEARELILNPPHEEGEEGDILEEEEEEVHGYVPPVRVPWESLGSEYEITDDMVVERPTRLRMTIERKRRDFGAPVNFKDRNVADVKDGYVDRASYEDKTFEVKVVEREIPIQVAPTMITIGCQTEWKYPVNSFTQYAPRHLKEEECEALLTTEDLVKSVEATIGRFDVSLQHNEIMNCFFDDYTNLADGEDGFGNKADNTLKEYQSFTDLEHSKEKAVTAIDWHPTLKGIVLVSVAEKLTFDQRVEQSARVVMSPSLIIIWSFTDTIKPQLLLEGPDDILCFQVCPSDPNIIAGGCINGQIVLWDISEHMESLRNVKNKSNKSKSKNCLPGFESDALNQVPKMRYCAVSQISESACHFAPITDLQWVPDHFEIARATGYALEARQFKNVQLLSAGADNSIYLWDIRSDKQAISKEKTKDADLAPPMGVPDTFQFLNLKWRPSLLIHLFKSEPGGDHNPVKFSLKEVQGDRAVLSLEQDETQGSKDHSKSMGGEFNYGGKNAADKNQRMLQNVNTHLYVGSEDGELVYVDWMPQKDQDTGKSQTPKPVFYNALHDGPVQVVQRSPFNKEIVLVIGGWIWSIWKEGVNSGPIISSAGPNPMKPAAAAAKPLTSGCWSPTRPSVFYVSHSDGSVDVWDLLDKTHEAVLTQNLSSTALTTVRAWNISSKQQLLVVGDMNGTLHVFQVPWRLRVQVTNETSALKNYLEREVKRRNFVVERWNFREQEKMEHEAKMKREAGIAPAVSLTDEEIVAKMKMEYDSYLNEEQAFLRELGLKDDDDDLEE